MIYPKGHFQQRVSNLTPVAKISLFSNALPQMWDGLGHRTEKLQRHNSFHSYRCESCGVWVHWAMATCSMRRFIFKSLLAGSYWAVPQVPTTLSKQLRCFSSKGKSKALVGVIYRWLYHILGLCSKINFYIYALSVCHRSVEKHIWKH